MSLLIYFKTLFHNLYQLLPFLKNFISASFEQRMKQINLDVDITIALLATMHNQSLADSSTLPKIYNSLLNVL